MKKKAVLITGANGEIGHGLIEHFIAQKESSLVALDLRDSAYPQYADHMHFVKGDIRNEKVLKTLQVQYEFTTIFHLAALLSTSGEKDPLLAHQVNVEGSVKLLQLAQEQSGATGVSVRFIFPSTIGVYGIRTVAEKYSAGKVAEDSFLTPITMYGVNKLYVENLGRYFSEYYQSLIEQNGTARVDFRSVRLPGVVSAATVPAGGTSDYGPEMLHAAAKGEEYACFVAEKSALPFMVMPDAVKSLIDIAAADPSKLTRRVYNVGSFAVSAKEIEQEIKKYFPGAKTQYSPHPARHRIVESWPADVDDSAARQDWGWQPHYDFHSAFENYLVPGVMERYGLLEEKKTANW